MSRNEFSSNGFQFNQQGFIEYVFWTTHHSKIQKYCAKIKKTKSLYEFKGTDSQKHKTVRQDNSRNNREFVG